MTTHIQRNLFNYSITAVSVAFLLALSGYVALISLTVANVAKENSYSASVASARAALSSLESEYLQIEASLTLGYASSLGLSEPSSTLFVSSNATTLSLNSH